jgi:hypothetical protein
VISQPAEYVYKITPYILNVNLTHLSIEIRLQPPEQLIKGFNCSGENNSDGLPELCNKIQKRSPKVLALETQSLSRVKNLDMLTDKYNLTILTN